MNILSFDVEDWQQGFIHRGINGWEKFESREGKNIDLILKLLDEYDTKATFFVLGKFAKKNPWIVKQIYLAGHEIASHSYSHIEISKLTPNEFKLDVRKSKELLSDIIGEKIIGYRAPRWSINSKCFWALDILAENGYKYDSSIFPSNIHPFGNSKYIYTPHLIELTNGGSIIEFPGQILNVFGFNLPIGGGFYFRAAPISLTQYALKRSKERNNYSMVYLHPFEFDKQVPRLKVGFSFRIIRYYKLDKTEPYLRRILHTMKFSSCKTYLESNINSFPLKNFSVS